eukprot:gnl/TRDRNA2_/TRDRNA2_84708_c0_seq4.p1 gnl/TRDRNA2_/TRDRNA2_84708_c0~~gnl/TRDRNA2_/TRDRNA2_84708_c0_seq4.p1  ORF type:complete len:491 (+),score=97.56 gnl/TRDRNA2_/TRDRNA2_84708_c0_seq4:251-1723(+)
MSSFSFMTAGLMCIFLLLLAGLANGVNVPGLMKKQGNRHFSESKANDDIMSSAQEKLAEADQGISDSELLAEAEPTPTIIPLRRESVPVRRQGKIVSYKTSYSGFVNVGYPEPQAFRVVFDTGSGHIILPSKACQSESCAVHATYDMSKSQTATPINVDGSVVKPGELCDQVTIGFGTGSVVGEFVKEKVCIGGRGCVDMVIVQAVEMSEQPFKSFVFDGIVGLGLKQLSLSSDFSFLHALQNSAGVKNAQFGVFVTENDENEASELALGGTNPTRYIAPLRWAKVADAHLGHWQVRVHGFRIGNRTIGDCSSGDCHAIVDTGTSHFGVPIDWEREVDDLLSVSASEDTKCRTINAPTVEIDIDDFTISLPALNYMRKLPLHGNDIAPPGETPEAPDQENEIDADPLQCKPKLMGVTLPPPMASKLFILGEPILHRYYTAYDWGRTTPQIGFALRKLASQESHATTRSEPESTDFIMLAQESISLTHGEL